MKRFFDRLRQYLAAPTLSALESQERRSSYSMSTGQAETQRLLMLRYRELAAHGLVPLNLREQGFQVFSQSDEDGKLLYIFALIGASGKRIVDLGSSNVRGINSANLIINHGWSALLVDGNEALIHQALRFYDNHPATRLYPPKLVQAWISAENVDALVSEHGFAGEVDLLSIDLDGVDWWIWKALSCVNPRVVVVEYQDIIGPDRALTVPYRPDFVAKDYKVNQGEAPNYAGASLPAFVKLGHEKGYRLVGCNRYGYNAFFVRNDLGQQLLPEVPTSSCFDHPLNRCFDHPLNRYGMMERWPLMQDMEWIEV